MPLPTEPSPDDLVDVATARAWIGLPPLANGATDPVMQLAITAVSQRIATWCSRTFVPTAATEVYDGVGSGLLCLRRFPIISLDSVVVDGVPAPLIEAGSMAYGVSHDGRRTLSYRGGEFSRGRQNVLIGYTAGLDPIPADLGMACLDWLAAGYLARGRSPDVTERKDGDSSEKYAASSATVTIRGRTVPMPASVYATLSQIQDNVPV